MTRRNASLSARAPRRGCRGRFLGDAASRLLRDLELDPLALEVGRRLPKPGVGAGHEDPQQVVHGQRLEQHHRVEARDELRGHAVLEQVLVLQPVAQLELKLLAHPTRLDHVVVWRAPLSRPAVTRWKTAS